MPNIKWTAVVTATDDCWYFRKLPSAVKFYSALQNSAIKIIINFFFQGIKCLLININKRWATEISLNKVQFPVPHHFEQNVMTRIHFVLWIFCTTRRVVPPQLMWQQKRKVHNKTEPDPQGQCGQRKVSCPYRAGMGSDEQKTGKTVI